MMEILLEGPTNTVQGWKQLQQFATLNEEIQSTQKKVSTGKNILTASDNPVGAVELSGLKIIRDQTKLPVIIDAGLGQASDATIAMELGCDGVLVNTAIAKAKKPLDMAIAFKNAVIAGRQSYLSGRIDKSLMGFPSSPKEGII